MSSGLCERDAGARRNAANARAGSAKKATATMSMRIRGSAPRLSAAPRESRNTRLSRSAAPMRRTLPHPSPSGSSILDHIVADATDERWAAPYSSRQLEVELLGADAVGA